MVQQVQAAKRRHRRQTLLWLYLPMALLALLIFAAVVLVALLPGGAQKSIVSDVMLLVLMLCPVMVCMLPVTILALFAVFGLNRVHDAAARPLRKLEGRSLIMAQRAGRVTGQINRKTIDLSSRLGFIYKLMGVFEERADR